MISLKSLHLLHRLTLEEYLAMCKNNRRTYILSPFQCPKDEMEELRSEMLEMRDMYMEEDVYQLQELRQQLEQVCGYKDRLV